LHRRNGELFFCSPPRRWKQYMGCNMRFSAASQFYRVRGNETSSTMFLSFCASSPSKLSRTCYSLARSN
jgi:hypothetical protein